MSNSSLNFAEISFKQAIDLTQSLLAKIEAGQINETEIQTIVSELVKTANGARGFFVTYLTADNLIGEPSSAVVEALRSHPETVAELLVKNIAMSAAQALYHRRNHAEEMVHSQRVQQRTAQLIELVKITAVYEYAQQLLESATTGEGVYKDFLERWGYDTEQRQVISQALQQVLAQAN